MKAKGTKDFVNELPQADWHTAKLSMAWDLGEQHTPFKNKEGNEVIQHQIYLAFELDSQNSEGDNFIVFFRCTLSISDKAKLKPIVEGLLHREVTAEEIEGGVDLEELIGKPLYLEIIHSEDGKYANVKTASKLPKAIKDNENNLFMPQFPFKAVTPKFIETAIAARIDVDPSEEGKVSVD